MHKGRYAATLHYIKVQRAYYMQPDSQSGHMSLCRVAIDAAGAGPEVHLTKWFERRTPVQEATDQTSAWGVKSMRKFLGQQLPSTQPVLINETF